MSTPIICLPEPLRNPYQGAADDCPGLPARASKGPLFRPLITSPIAIISSLSTSFDLCRCIQPARSHCHTLTPWYMTFDYLCRSPLRLTSIYETIARDASESGKRMGFTRKAAVTCLGNTVLDRLNEGECGNGLRKSIRTIDISWRAF